MKENIKIALIGLIAVTLIINTFMKGEDDSSAEHDQNSSAVVNPPASSAVASDGSMKNNPNVQKNDPIVDNRPKTVMVFDEYDYDFGDVEQNTENEHIFKFHNDGQEPLVITDAKGSCGCTVPEYPKEPIPPGESGEIKVVYSSGNQQNKQTKSVTITANTDPGTTVLKINANVLSGEVSASTGE